MLPPDSDPVLAEAAAAASELSLARRVARTSPPGSPASATASSSVTQLEGRLTELLEDPEHCRLIYSALDQRSSTLRIAVRAWQQTLEQQKLVSQAREISIAAARDGRRLLAAEAAQQSELVARSEHCAQARAQYLGEHLVDTATRDAVLAVLSRLRIREARDQLQRGLLLTQQMRDIIAESVPALAKGEPLLLLGETGGAKTALAEHLSRAELGREPEFISGYGDISSTQLVGSHELRPQDGATVSIFVPGPLLRAMTEGRPLILDEINAMPPEFLKRLNRVLQLRPGDHFAVQENGGAQVVIQPGFAILATANEQTPHRYRGIDRMSAELVNRFGANSYRVHYPDTGRSYTDVPAENLLLAAAAIADTSGHVPLASDLLERVCRAAFISQQVFSGLHGGEFRKFVSTEREIDGRPGLEESVLAPRTLVSIVQKVTGSGGQISLDRALRRFVEGVMHAEDREVLTLILKSQGLLAD